MTNTNTQITNNSDVEKFFEFNQDALNLDQIFKDPYGELTEVTHPDSETFLLEQLIMGLHKIENVFAVDKWN